MLEKVVNAPNVLRLVAPKCAKRDRGDRFCADAGVDHGQPADRGGDPARARIQSGAAVQRRLAGYRAAGNSCAHERENPARASAPQRGDRPRRSEARVTSYQSDGKNPLKKKAAWFLKRPFLSYGGSTLTGD